MSLATSWRLNLESCECEEFSLQLPDAIWYHLHSKPRAEGQENQDGKRRSGRYRTPPKPGRRVPSTPLTHVGAQASLGPGSPAQDRSIRSHPLILTTKLLPSCVLAIPNTQACIRSTGISEATPLYPISLSVSAPPGLVLQARCPSFPITGPLCLIISVVRTQTRRTQCGVTAPWIKRALARSLTPPCPEFPDTEPQRLEVFTVPRSSSCVSSTQPPRLGVPTVSRSIPAEPPSPVPCNPNNRPPLLRSSVVSRSGPHAFEPLFSQPSTTISL